MSIFKSLILLVSLSFSNVWAADSYWVESLPDTEISSTDKASVQELIRMAVTQKATLALSAKQAQFTLRPTLLKLGDSYILTLQKRNKVEQVVFSEKMKAKTMSEMDNVATRLTEAVIEQKSFARTEDVTNVTQEDETSNIRRRQVTRQWMIGLGPGWTSNLRSRGGGFTFLLGYLWGLDPDYSIGIAWTLNSGPESDDSSYSDFSIGGEYNFNRSKASPFIGARMGYASARVNRDSCTAFFTCSQDRASGWSGTLTGGYKMFRTSAVNAAIMGTYSYIFDQTYLGNPSLFGIQLVVYY